MTIVSVDFAYRQKHYVLGRRVIRDFLLRTLAFRILARVEVEGVENIPASGPTLVYMNHMSGVDVVVLIGTVTSRFVVPMSKIENFHIPLLGQLMRVWGVYPVRRGQVDVPAIQHTINLLEQGNLVMIAPEGTRQPALIKGRDGMTFAATRTRATLVPAAIEGTREFSHNIKRLHKTHIRLKIGRPFRFHKHGRLSRPELSAMTQEAMYVLAGLLPEHRRGYYADLGKATTDTLEFL